MAKALFAGLAAMLILLGCSRIDRDGVISQELPITLDDLAEIRSGEINHEKVLLEYNAYSSGRLEAYLNAIAASIADVSTRPHLPYRVVLLQTEEVNMFGGPGGYIYITQGLLNFVQSESELAGLIAHEIGHISHYDYSHVPQLSAMKKVYKGLMKGTELARDSIGTYGTVAYYGVKGIGKAAPYVAGRFNSDAEIQADRLAVQYLIDAGYDPRGYFHLVERLSQVDMYDVSRFVIFLDVHPPFEDRRRELRKRVEDTDEKPGDIMIRKDTLNEVRQASVNRPDSILFEPQLAVYQATLLTPEEMQQQDDFRHPAPVRERGSWM